MSELQSVRKSFLEQLTEELRRRDTPLDTRKPTGDYYYKNGIGNQDWHLAFQAKTQPSEISCHLVSNTDATTFDELFSERAQIHEEMGEQLLWISPENADTTRYRVSTRQTWDVFETDRWSEYIEWLINTGERFDSVFRPRLT